MSIKINEEKCTGCGKCLKVCPGNLLTADQAGRAISRAPQDCWGCTACVKECRFEAIDYYLGADLGGRGTVLRTRQADNCLQWIFTKPSGDEKIIAVNRHKANRY